MLYHNCQNKNKFSSSSQRNSHTGGEREEMKESKKIIAICCADCAMSTSLKIKKLYPQDDILQISYRHYYDIPESFDVMIIACRNLLPQIEEFRKDYKSAAVIKIGEQIPD